MEGSGSEVDRRRFLALAGASLGLAKAGCSRQPLEQIVPHVRQPEESPQGQSVDYATARVDRGVAAGLVVRSLTGRPLKVEGNPDHPASLGATDPASQASIHSLYDPARAQVVTRLGRITTWSRVAGELAGLVEARRAGGGGLRLLTGTVTSPSLGAEIAALLAMVPGARWHRFEPCGDHNGRAGRARALEAPHDLLLDVLAADVIVSLDSDFAADGPGSLRHARDLARRRAPGGAGALGHASALTGLPPSRGMNRMYSIESSPTPTGTLADHWLALRPTEVSLFAASLAVHLGVLPPDALPPDVPPAIERWAPIVARDLRRAGPRGLVIAGEPASPAVHVLAAAMNDALGSVGTTVFYIPPVEVDPVDHVASITELTADMRAGKVSLLLVLHENPAYSAPSDLDFATAMESVETRVHLSLFADETSELCHYHVPAAHHLEQWGDARAFDGTLTPIQPLIDPLYEGKSDLELVAAARGRARPGRDVVREHWQSALGAPGFEARWSDALRRGLLEGTAFTPVRPALSPTAARAAASEIAGAARQRNGYEVAIRPDPTVGGGELADNAWLQELPKPLTKLTWANAALLSTRSAAEIGVATGDVVDLALAGRVVRAAVLVLSRHPDDTLTVHLGYGRRAGGGVATGLGFDAYRLRSAVALWGSPGLLVRKTGESRPFARTQGHFELHGRPIARSVTLAELERDPGVVRSMGEHPEGPRLSLYPGGRREGRQWAMAIDQSVCTGCSACVVACQAENNIPAVGEAEVLAGREMHWLRIDHYEVPSGREALVVNQPMMCVHCELAPCEYVCPVAATTHSAEGLNEMTYNRCVGTRYCQNNCPYKVRRFNFFDYQSPPAEVSRLRHNPDVTVRSRGVMEKCTYCIQRIAAGRIRAEIERRGVADGEVVTACQQACPTGAITFGDLSDPAARVVRLKADPRSYEVLEELGTRPRTSHLARVRNTNPELDDDG